MIILLSNIMFGIGFSFIAFFIFSLTKPRNRNAAQFSIMCLSLAIFVLGYALELRAQDLEQYKFCLKLEYFGAPFMTVFWFLFAYKYYYNKSASYRLILLIMIIPVTTLFISVTNDYHHLLYANIALVQYDGFLLGNITKGPWYYFYSLYAYIILAIGIVLFYKIWRRSMQKMKTQAFLMFFGTIWPIIINIFYLFGFSPYGLDLTPFGLFILVICYAIALFKLGFLELQEIVKGITFSEIGDGIIVVDHKNRLLDFNTAGQKVFGWLCVHHIGEHLSEFEWGEEIIAHTESPFVIEIEENNRKNTYEFRITPLKEKGHTLGIVYFFQDISEQQAIIEKLNYLASYDALTQVYNRRKLMEEAEKESVRAKRYYDCISVLMIDIDFFKKVNDQYGHLAGDEVIRHVADACKSRIRNIDIIGRYGGEEFVIILANADQHNALKVAESIRVTIETLKIIYEHHLINVTVSIGVSTLVGIEGDIDIVKVIDRADCAMYRSKETGRNRICVDL
jgi:diguanylate cyclase (GGDEF)-like protein/PAS domain S-box-containing protein